MNQQQLKTPMSLRWGIIGTGSVSRAVVPDIEAVEGQTVTLIFSRDPSKAATFASEFSVSEWSSDYSAVLDNRDVDIVYIATPIARHHEMAAAALRAGKHVLVEKPFTRTEAEAAELFALSSEHGRFVMEAMWTKFNPAYIRILEMLRTGRIGEPRSLRAAFGAPFDREQFAGKWDMQRSGGALLDQGVYAVTLAHAVFGEEPTDIHAHATTFLDDVDVTEHFTLEFSGGRFAQTALSIAEFIDMSGSVSGTEGWIAIPAPFWASRSLTVHGSTVEEWLFAPESVAVDSDGNGFTPMIRAVVEAIEGGEVQHPAHDESATLAVTRTLERIRSHMHAHRERAGE